MVRKASSRVDSWIQHSKAVLHVWRLKKAEGKILVNDEGSDGALPLGLIEYSPIIGNILTVRGSGNRWGLA
jgi:hypothetical protein